jgi:hypothetical protein
VKDCLIDVGDGAAAALVKDCLVDVGDGAAAALVKDRLVDVGDFEGVATLVAEAPIAGDWPDKICRLEGPGVSLGAGVCTRGRARAASSDC